MPDTGDCAKGTVLRGPSSNPELSDRAVSLMETFFICTDQCGSLSAFLIISFFFLSFLLLIE